MFSLPPANHPARTMFDVEDLVSVGCNGLGATTLPDAKRVAREMFATQHSPALSRVCFIVLRADDAVHQISIGPRGGVRVEWVFRK